MLRNFRNSLTSRLVGIVIGLAVPFIAYGQAFPSKPLNLVVTVPAGGSIDAMARAISAELSPALGQPVVVVNRAGAGGNIAAEYVAKSPADGYTLLITASSTFAINPYVYRNLPFDPVNSFAPIVMPARLNMILAVHPKLNVSSLNEFIARLRDQSGTLNYGSSGSGTLPHLAGELLDIQTGSRANHVPYKGIAPALNDLLAGQIDFMFDSASSIPHVNAGKVRALAVVGPGRLSSLPNVPTFRELGFPAMEAASGWYGIFAPAGTPTNVIHRLNTEIVRILRMPSVTERVAAMGLEAASSSPDELAAILKEDLRRMGPIVKQANVALQ